MPAEAEPRKFLIATATAHYKNARAWDRPGLVQARLDIIDLFCHRFGYQHVTDLGLDPTEHQLTRRLREFCKSSERREDDLVTVYIGGHGEVLDEDAGGGHVLLTHDSEPDDIADALATETLARKMLADTKVRRLLLLLDTCYSGQGGNEVAVAALERMSRRWGATPGSGLVIVSSAQPLEQAQTGFFPRGLREAVEDMATAGHGPKALAVEAVVARMNTAPGHQRIGLTQVGLTGEVPPFLPNPHHAPRLTEVDLAIQQDATWQREADRRDRELDNRLLLRAMGYSGDNAGWWFAGRRTALADITAWLMASHRDSVVGVGPALAVTGGPGSGKTAVLGIIAALAHPEVHRSVPLSSLNLDERTVHAALVVDVAVYAQGLTNDQVLDALAAAAQVTANTPGELLDALDRRSHPLCVLIDGLDEAATPDALCITVLHPLITHGASRIRLLLGTRPHLLPRLGLRREEQIDLDADRYADSEAVLTYTVRNLIQAHSRSPYRQALPRVTLSVAKAVAAAAGGSFLVARLAASTLAATSRIPEVNDQAWRASLPKHAGQAMAEDLDARLGVDAARATDLLRPLAYAQGQGLPWEDLWAPMASAVSGRRYTDRDIRWLLYAAGSYIIEAVEDGRSAYRLYHEALAEHLRNSMDTTRVHRVIARVLAEQVPYGSNGTRDWAHAHPYTLHHLAAHAREGGVLDAALSDVEYLVHADPHGLVPHLHTVRDERARVAAAVYRASVGTHRQTTPEQRRQILALDAARYDVPALQTSLNSRARPGQWIPLHSTGSMVSPVLRNILTGHASTVNTIACTVLDGRAVAVSASHDTTVRIWDLATGQPVGQPLVGHTDAVHAIACTALDGRPIAVTGSGPEHVTDVRDDTVRIWDLTTGQPHCRPLTGHTGSVTSVAITVLDDRPVAVSASMDATVRIWDLASGQSHSQPITGHTEAIYAVACTKLDGRAVAITASFDRTVQIWDLATRQSLGILTTDHNDLISHVATTVLDGRAIAITAPHGHSVRIWDLTTGQPHRTSLAGHTSVVNDIACTVLDGRTVAVTASHDDTVRIWDLATGQPLRQPLTGHSSTVTAVATTDLDGRPVAVTGSHDRTVRIWDLSADNPQPQSLNRRPGHTGMVRAVATALLDHTPITVTTSDDDTLRVWDLKTGKLHRQPITSGSSMVFGVATTELDGRPVAVTTSIDQTVRIWDLKTGKLQRQPLTGHTDMVTAVALTELDSRPLAVTVSHDHTARIWDLTTGQPHGSPLEHPDIPHAVACTVLNGRPVAVIACWDGTLRTWDLSTARLMTSTPTIDVGRMGEVATTEFGGHPVAVTASESALQIWDLTTGHPVGRPMPSHSSEVTALVCTWLDGSPIGVIASVDGSISMWNLINRTEETRLWVPARVEAVAVQGPNTLVCSFGSDVAVFGRSPH
jgi:WD40 repeat protein